MSYAWSSRDRLAPMRMVPCDQNEPKYEMEKYRMPRARRRHVRLGWHVCPLLPDRGEALRHPPGRLGEWPVFKYGKRKKIKLKS